MRELTLCCETFPTPAHASARAHALLDAVRAGAPPALCLFAVPGDVLAIGRYHAVPPPRPGSRIDLLRRVGGGRAAPMGSGFAGMALALPHRSALVDAAPASLALSQLLNRAVRGLLGALERLGLAPHYPGRDVVTVDGRVIALLGFEVAPDGATLVEACLATRRSFAELAAFADAADPAGVVPVDLLLPDQATSVEQARGREVGLDELRAALASGYAARLGLDVAMVEPPPAPAPDAAWLEAGRVPAELDRRAATRDLLGVIEVHAARRDARVSAVRIGGDLLAPSAAVARVEAAFRDAPVDLGELRRRAATALPDARAELLGIRNVEVLGDLVHEACAS